MLTSDNIAATILARSKLAQNMVELDVYDDRGIAQAATMLMYLLLPREETVEHFSHPRDRKNVTCTPAQARAAKRTQQLVNMPVHVTDNKVHVPNLGSMRATRCQT